ncbi:MAG TPA: tripartite tricarboxylate transporter substrate binding protein [Ramlibacter sp.]|uniref:Bug family tripartite tricarboxylate transporter substrate binding protein n=1 Tax=Ramlibacter sp. TaxID=1917967 RepID=UPI002B9BAF30|nr:tripartite tricarboxylate transporter substrate binding protein [Ramlibacter sp.]HVZ45655.1 tripartite tricarboxylate transporter substrate binding protein [Ramlibacter sp.]
MTKANRKISPGSRRRAVAWTAALLASACLMPAAPAIAGTYPDRAVTIVSAFPPGGIVDVIARRLAQRLGEQFKQNFIVDNRTGAAGSIGYSAVARSAPDGYTLVVASGPTTMAPPGSAIPSFQPQTAFSAIGMIGTIPQAIIVANTLPVRTLPDLVAYARSHPGQVNYGSAGAGTTPFFTMELLNAQQKVKLTHVPYRGQPEVMTDLIRGDIGVTAMTVPLVVQPVQAGRIRALAVTSSARLASLPDVPTVTEQGMPGLAISNWFALMGPAGMPPDVISALSAALSQALAAPDVRASLGELGLVIQPSPPAETLAFVQADLARWIAMSQSLGAEPNHSKEAKK